MKKLIKLIALKWKKLVTVKWLMFLIKIQRKARRKSAREAIEAGKKITAETGRKVLIYFIDGEYKPLTKQELKAIWRKGGAPKGYTIQELESFAEIKIESYENKNRKTTVPGNKVVFAGN